MLLQDKLRAPHVKQVFIVRLDLVSQKLALVVNTRWEGLIDVKFVRLGINAWMRV
jgi:hypothetical protein